MQVEKRATGAGKDAAPSAMHISSKKRTRAKASKVGESKKGCKEKRGRCTSEPER